MRRVVFPAFLLALAVYVNPAFALKFIGWGDTRDNANVQQQVADRMETEKPEAILFSGDMEGSYSSAGFTAWKGRLTKNHPNLTALINAGNFAWAIGNHEGGGSNGEGGFNNIKNSGMVKGSSLSYYSWKQGNCFFVCMGYMRADQYAWLRTQLNSDSSKAAKWRFIFQHKPIYSSFTGHGANGDVSEGSDIKPYRKMCDTFKVTAQFSGHDHGYQRSKLLNANAVVATASPYDIQKTPGTIYMMNGSGGAPYYSFNSATWSAFAQKVNGYTVINATDDTCYFETKNTSGAIVDNWIIVDKDPVVSVRKSVVSAVSSTPSLTYSAQSLSYTVSENANVSLRMFNARGELVSTLVEGNKNAGSYSVQTGKMLAGIYIAELKVNGKSTSQKITVN
ncbi:MAG: metallophosphoesterase [Chitinispirillaceae bacterium]|jgi:hypothetical protein|nr:metallophosphoesterase [Chitinispirillaceae bacterium]